MSAWDAVRARKTGREVLTEEDRAELAEALDEFHRRLLEEVVGAGAQDELFPAEPS